MDQNLEEIARRSKVLDEHLAAAMRLAQVALPQVKKIDPLRCWVFYNERGEPQHVAEEPFEVAWGRHGNWVVMESKPFSEVRRVN